MKDHPNLSPAINHNLRLTEAMGGWWLGELPACAGTADSLLKPGRMLRIQTRNTLYALKHHPDNPLWMLIKGHPKYCPDWTTCHVAGSTWGGSMLRMKFVGVGMHLEFSVFDYIDGLCEGTITTTPMQEIEECAVD